MSQNLASGTVHKNNNRFFNGCSGFTQPFSQEIKKLFVGKKTHHQNPTNLSERNWTCVHYPVTLISKDIIISVPKLPIFYSLLLLRICYVRNKEL